MTSSSSSIASMCGSRTARRQARRDAGGISEQSMAQISYDKIIRVEGRLGTALEKLASCMATAEDCLARLGDLEGSMAVLQRVLLFIDIDKVQNCINEVTKPCSSMYPVLQQCADHVSLFDVPDVPDAESPEKDLSMTEPPPGLELCADGPMYFDMAALDSDNEVGLDCTDIHGVVSTSGGCRNISTDIGTDFHVANSSVGGSWHDLLARLHCIAGQTLAERGAHCCSDESRNIGGIQEDAAHLGSTDIYKFIASLTGGVKFLMSEGYMEPYDHNDWTFDECGSDYVSNTDAG